MNLIEVMDYIDADVAYLLGLITGRGRISESGPTRQIIIEFPYQALHVEGTSGSYNANTSIRLGLQDIRERLLELTGADITITPKENSVALILRFIRNTMVWRNILMHVEGPHGVRTLSSSTDFLFSRYSKRLEARIYKGIRGCGWKYQTRQPLC